MDELKSIFQELLSVWVDSSAIPVARAGWFTLRPDTSTLNLFTKQHMVFKTDHSNIRIGVELSEGSAIPFITLNPAQIFTFLVELNEPAFLNLAKDLISPPVPGTTPAFTNQKKGMPLQAITISNSTYTYLPKSKKLTSLSLQNEVSGQVEPLPLPINGAGIKFSSTTLPEGLYQVIENGAAVNGTEFFERGRAANKFIYAIIKILHNPAFLSSKPADHQLTIVLNPK